MIIVDDLFVRPFVSILDSIHALALEEMYDVGEIQNQLKENRLFYELGERSEEEYERRKAELEEELRIAESAHEQLRNKQIRVRQ
ncbi:gas vesicle protein GvpG [Halobacterium wangiae]|uniref:gas vesicle protein GvpG n=1 Tax=Halobacterium wangiae TaxID=2902623 RepID=UPI001E3C18AE|nr:protein gvpG [Halobacterium wangiae]